jgi:carbon monoxide dehydrogenase subunit G
VKGSGELNLKEAGSSTPKGADSSINDAGSATEIQYTGEVNVGGLIASVGQRMIQSSANLLAGRFFKALESEVKGKALEVKGDSATAEPKLSTGT